MRSGRNSERRSFSRGGRLSSRPREQKPPHHTDRGGKPAYAQFGQRSMYGAGAAESRSHGAGAAKEPEALPVNSNLPLQITPQLTGSASEQNPVVKHYYEDIQ